MLRKFKILQLRVNVKREPSFVDIGEVTILNESSKLDNILDDIWHACNVDSWDDSGLWEINRRINLENISIAVTDNFSGNANADIIITDEKNINFLSESFGWKTFTNLNTAKEYLLEQYNKIYKL